MTLVLQKAFLDIYTIYRHYHYREGTCFTHTTKRTMNTYMMIYIFRQDMESPAGDKVVTFDASNDNEARIKMHQEKKNVGELGSSFELFRKIDS